jgi:hypothetical protein
MENIRITVNVEAGAPKPVVMSIVTTGVGDQVSLDDVAGQVDIDGKQVPIITTFQASLEPLDEGAYLVSWTFGMQVPVVSGTSKTSAGMTRSSYTYRNMGGSSRVRMKPGQKLNIIEGSMRRVSLQLDRVEPESVKKD